LLPVDLARLREQLSDLGLMALILCLQQQFPVDHEPAIVINNCYAAVGVQLIWLMDLPCSLKLQQIRDVDRIAAEGIDIIALVLGLHVVPVSRLEMISELQMAIRVLIESELGQRLVLVGQGCDAVDLVDLRGGASTITYRSISRHQILMCVAIVAQQHALADRVHAAANGAALCMQQCAVEPTLREEDPRVRAVQVIVVEVLHHKEGPSALLLAWQQKLIVHG